MFQVDYYSQGAETVLKELNKQILNLRVITCTFLILFDEILNTTPLNTILLEKVER